ncbi:hypothetical protein LWC34_14245 [Kibdelosporangium philippinense]|uniref:Uncharacterized protein n=1 Tax=Kibdelosporangium philippinense TaxID=211113 RepID=A0ABS8Z996_9PSEU|nr:hypothetical protein [Kibdelosporangium philippinense]MCE7003982.1 hypothetical protein [Kibdelosporangium philippinense]
MPAPHPKFSFRRTSGHLVAGLSDGSATSRTGHLRVLLPAGKSGCRVPWACFAGQGWADAAEFAGGLDAEGG